MQSTPKFPKNKHFLPPDTHTHVSVSGGKKCLFFGNFGVLCFLEIPVLRFALLPYYRGIGESVLFCNLKAFVTSLILWYLILLVFKENMEVTNFYICAFKKRTKKSRDCTSTNHVIFLHGCFSRFLNCTNTIKLHKASHILQFLIDKI